MKRLKPEEVFLQQVLELAQIRGWRRAHFRPAETAKGYRTAVQADGKGFPDVFLLRRTTGSKLIAELKVPPNECTPEQKEWLADCEAVGITAWAAGKPPFPSKIPRKSLHSRADTLK
jgi:VRR-NUC domain